MPWEDKSSGKHVDDFGRDYNPSSSASRSNDWGGRSFKRRSPSPDGDRGRDSVGRDSRQAERRRSFSPETYGYKRPRDDERGRDHEFGRDDRRRPKSPGNHREREADRSKENAPFGYRQDGKPYDFWEFAYSWDDLLSLKAFSENYRAAHPQLQARGEETDKILAAEYTKYRQGFSENQCRKFFVSHKSEEWFQEKYDPALSVEYRLSLVSRKQKDLENFLKDLDQGKFASLNYDDVNKPSRVARLSSSDSTAELQRSSDDLLASDSVENIGDDVPLPDGSAAAEASTGKKLHITYVPVDMHCEKLQSCFKELPGFEYMGFSLPNPSKQFSRQAWVQFSPDTELAEILKMLEGRTVTYEKRTGEGKSVVEYIIKAQVYNGYTSYGRDAPEDAASDEKLDLVVKKAQEIARKCFEELSNDLSDRTFKAIEAAAAVESDVTAHKKRLVDLHVELLRRVFWRDIYTGMECFCYEEFERRCPPFYRKPLIAEPPATDDSGAVVDSQPTQQHRYRSRYSRERDSKEDAARFWSRLEERANLILSPYNLASGADASTLDESVQASNALVLKLGGVYVDVAIRKKLDEQKLLEQIDDSRFRCGITGCGKMFKTADFLSKHITNKHPSMVEPIVAEAEFCNKYASDPHKISWYNQIVAQRERDPSVGHFYSDYVAIARASRNANQVTPQMSARLVGMVGNPNFQSMMQFNPLLAAAAMMNISGMGSSNRYFGGSRGGFRGRGYNNRGRGGPNRGRGGAFNARRKQNYVDVDEQVSGGGEDMLLSYD